MCKRQQVLAEHAHRLRQQHTDSEARLLRALRASQLGQPFRRQVVLLGFIVDFFCPKARLVVEVDGGYHARRVGADAKRERLAALIANAWLVALAHAPLVRSSVQSAHHSYAAVSLRAAGIVAIQVSCCSFDPFLLIFDISLRSGGCIPRRALADNSEP